MKWRLTYTEEQNGQIQSSFMKEEGRPMIGKPSIKNCPKLEIRAENGDFIRINQGGELVMIDSPLGEIPMTYGEIYARIYSRQKYRTSCYTGRSASAGPLEYFIRPLENGDEYFALNGDLIIFEYDKDGKPYDIASVREGQSRIVNFSEKINGYRKYESMESMDIKDSDFEYILNNFIDHRKWK